MEEEFVDFNTALALKELRYPQVTVENYNKSIFGYYYKEKFARNSGMRLHHNFDKSLSVSAPFYSQVFRFFREKHSLDSHIKQDWTDGFLYGYESIIECEDGLINIGTFKTYEEAELECIKKLIKLCKKNL